MQAQGGIDALAKERWFLILACCCGALRLHGGDKRKVGARARMGRGGGEDADPRQRQGCLRGMVLGRLPDHGGRAESRRGEANSVRILEPQGREYAHCGAEYDRDEKLNYFHSWTIAADGRQFQAKDTDFRDEGAYADAEAVHRALPHPESAGRDPGAVVACETELHLRPYMDIEGWQIQQPIPVVYEALELALPAGGHYADSWSHFTPVKPMETADGHLRWEIKDMPGLDLENLHATPPRDALAARMTVKWGDSAVKGVENQWRAIGQWKDQLEAHGPTPRPRSPRRRRN